ncbi:hypothetical protein PGTUg99_012874 [Puccinia graminis f. sp. tritici]|uniref:Uncharacterized protein n=1 Tax=Puccinia graminis f. sp. tritici TaxID=56615 RepID=A0A5B0NVN7_PUCGR|nr:hypothetical protein PGTUg99_012874 [Puccinia graminis f. sp. tritici]
MRRQGKPTPICDARKILGSGSLGSAGPTSRTLFGWAFQTLQINQNFDKELKFLFMAFAILLSTSFTPIPELIWGSRMKPSYSIQASGRFPL